MRRRDLAIVLCSGLLSARSLRAQQETIPVIGWLSGSSVGPYAWNMAAFRQGLSETGYVEGQNVAIEIWAEGRADRLPELAADLVGRKVSVIVAQGGNFSALAAKNATSAIPIVFLAGSDPVGTGPKARSMPLSALSSS
jgi:putative ABC transport system substrate-binding protein